MSEFIHSHLLRLSLTIGHTTAVVLMRTDREVILSFREGYLLPSWRTLRLGAESPPRTGSESESFVDALRRNRSFADPHRVDRLSRYFDINPYETIHDPLITCPSYGELRRAQSKLYVTNTYVPTISDSQF